MQGVPNSLCVGDEDGVPGSDVGLTGESEGDPLARNIERSADASQE